MVMVWFDITGKLIVNGISIDKIQEALGTLQNAGLDTSSVVASLASLTPREEERKVKEYNPFCDDPECPSCNGLGADGHIW